jgi:hypothetical protein
MFTFTDLMLVILYMLKALATVAGLVACFLLTSRLTIYVARHAPWPVPRNRQ